MLLVDGDTVLATPDQLAGVTVTGKVVGEAKGPKIIGFTYKPSAPTSAAAGATASSYTVVEITRSRRRARSADVEDQRWRLNPQRP